MESIAASLLMAKNPYINILIAGDLNQEFVIDLSGRPTNNFIGGSLLYAAAGASMWHKSIGLVGRIGNNFPGQWVQQIEKRGLDTCGIFQLSQAYDLRKFYFWRDAEHCYNDAPVAAYARYGLTFPHDLLGFSPQSVDANEKMWRNVTPHLNPTFPQEYIDISGAHLCPINLNTQIKLIDLLQKGLVNTISISPSDEYMTPASWNQLPAILKGISIFSTREDQLISLFQGRSKDVWEMAVSLSELGCPLIAIACGEKGFYLYNAANASKFVLPFYPARWVDPTGINHVFAGAFLARYKQDYDPLQALISGAVSASLAVEGTGPFYCLDSFSGLASARSELLLSMLKKI